MNIPKSHFVILISLLGVSALILQGCGSAGPTVGGSGVGADGSPWPTAPTRNTGTNTTANESPKAPLTIVLHAKTNKGEAISLNVAKVELKYDKDQWLSVATGETIGKLQTQPLKADENGASALLVKAPVDRRLFNDIRITFAKEKTALVLDKNSIPLTVDTATVSIGSWKPDDKSPNTITLNVDGSKIAKNAASARLSASSISARTSLPTGSISGVISPETAAVKVEAIWADSSVSFGQAIVAADGSFTIPNLPQGRYLLKVTAAGYKPATEIKPITVDEKMVVLDKTEMVKE